MTKFLTVAFISDDVVVFRSSKKFCDCCRVRTKEFEFERVQITTQEKQKSRISKVEETSQVIWKIGVQDLEKSGVLLVGINVFFIELPQKLVTSSLLL